MLSLVVHNWSSLKAKINSYWDTAEAAEKRNYDGVMDKSRYMDKTRRAGGGEADTGLCLN